MRKRYYRQKPVVMLVENEKNDPFSTATIYVNIESSFNIGGCFAYVKG